MEDRHRISLGEDTKGVWDEVAWGCFVYFEIGKIGGVLFL